MTPAEDRGPLGSYCLIATCLAHHRCVFVQLWPHDDGQLYSWVHTDLTPCPGIPAEDAGAVLMPEDWQRRGAEWSPRRLTRAEMAGAS